MTITSRIKMDADASTRTAPYIYTEKERAEESRIAEEGDNVKI